jgi:hypothetical protein
MKPALTQPMPGKRKVMITFNKTLAALALGLAVAAGGSAALAKGRTDNHGGYVDNNGGYPVSAARAAALRQCTARESQWIQRDWGVQALEAYRTCMFEHRQME